MPALVALNDPRSLVRLPRSIWRREFNHPRAAAWVAPDGSQMLIVAMDSLPDMASGEDLTGVLRKLRRPSFRSSACRMTMDGRTARLWTGIYVDSSATDTVFSVSATALVRPGLALVATGLAPTQAMRDSLVAMVGSVRFTEPR